MDWACAKNGESKFAQDDDGQMFVKGPVRKPKKRWIEAVKDNSYQILKWRIWEVKAQDRDE
jgi:hypothetical protein